MSLISGNEVKTYLEATGLIATPPSEQESLLDFAGVAHSAEQAFLQSVRWFPFVSEGTTQTRQFDPPSGRLLDLQGGLLSLTSVTVSGMTLTPNVDVFLSPQNAGYAGLPYSGLEFYRNPCGRKRSISVTGVWGRVTSLPDDVREGLLAKAATLLAPQLHAYISRGLSKWREGDVEQWSHGENFANIEASWTQIYADTVRRYRRTTIA